MVGTHLHNKGISPQHSYLTYETGIAIAIRSFARMKQLITRDIFVSIVMTSYEKCIQSASEKVQIQVKYRTCLMSLSSKTQQTNHLCLVKCFRLVEGEDFTRSFHELCNTNKKDTSILYIIINHARSWLLGETQVLENKI